MNTRELPQSSNPCRMYAIILGTIDIFYDDSLTLEQKENKIKESSASKTGFYVQVMHLL